MRAVRLVAGVCTGTRDFDPLPASMRVAESFDLLEVIVEHCGLLRLDTLKRVCRSCGTIWPARCRRGGQRPPSVDIWATSWKRCVPVVLRIFQTAVGFPWLPNQTLLA